jgi:general secretion pathway protein H
MRTSATGARAHAEAGFTLIEVMVTLLILGLIAGAVALTVPDGRPRLSDETERLAARLTRAREEAVLTNRGVDVAISPQGYGFRVLSKGAWAPLREAPFQDGVWGEGLTVKLESADGRGSVRFDPTGMAGPARVVLRQGPDRMEVTVDEAGDVRIDAPVR